MRELSQIIRDSVAMKEAILSDRELLVTISEVSQMLAETLGAGRKALFCGNGGSAADAQHLAAEFSGRFLFDRPPLYAEALHVNTSYLTAVANDYSYADIYSRMLRGSGREGDVLFGLTTSGNSPNILQAAQVARELGMVVVGMTGRTGGKLKEYCSYLINVPSETTAHIQEAHITIGHAMSEFVEETLFSSYKPQVESSTTHVEASMTQVEV
jgi:D-sedoheptulose 7-phosphate isomerase